MKVKRLFEIGQRCRQAGELLLLAMGDNEKGFQLSGGDDRAVQVRCKYGAIRCCIGISSGYHRDIIGISSGYYRDIIGISMRYYQEMIGI
jgi:hypothetical protein